MRELSGSNVVELNSEPIWDRRALLPDGAYAVALKDWRTVRLFQRDVLQCAFIVVEGERFGDTLIKYYNVQFIGKPKRHGRFKAARGGDLVHDYARCFGKPPRLDRIPLTRFVQTTVMAITRTVTTDSHQRKAPDCLHWSTFERLQQP